MKHCLRLPLILFFVSLSLVGCSSGNDSDEPAGGGVTPVKGEWIAAVDYIGELQKDGDSWQYIWARDEYPAQFGLTANQTAVVSISNWRDDFAQYASGCRVTGYYRATAIETFAGREDKVLYISMRIDKICQYPEPAPAAPTEEEYALIAGRMEINTGGAAITSKEDYVNATISLAHDNEEWNIGEVTAGVRGRGNSTWLWYPKKPYRIKFDKKQALLGLPKAKSWVLLAEYRDPTDLMNAYVFELGQLMGMPYTNHNRYVELILNGKSQGLYHLTEQVQQNENRVDIDEFGGYLIQLDADDGPGLAPDATDNFWSAHYRMPVCVKNPDEPAPAILDEAKASLGELEKAIAGGDFAEIEKLLDVESMINFLIIQELVYNVELDAPRSMYMHKDIGGDKWHMGPLWDFDAGFDFDWSNMTTSHNYFSSYRELVLGTKPATHAGTSYRVPAFFSDLFKISAFVSRYKARWAEVKAMHDIAWSKTYSYYEANAQLWHADAQMWPIGKTPGAEIAKMQAWLANRINYLDAIVAGY